MSGESGPAAGGPGAAPAASGSELVLEIDDLAFGGRGVGRARGLVVFVEGALPGESVRARVLRRRAGYAEAELQEVLRPAVERVSPRCAHYGECGGCDLQHLEAAAQARAKGAQVRALLQRLAGIPDPPVREAMAAGDPWGYRFRMDFDWRSADRGAARLGLHRRGRPAEIVAVRHCDILPEPGNAILQWLAAEAERRGLQAWDRRRRRGLLRRAGLQQAGATGEILLSLETGRGDPPALAALARDLVRRFPRVVGVVRREIDRHGDPAGDSILSGRDHLFEEVEGDRFRIPSGAFFQPHRGGAGRLRREVAEAIGPRGSDTILELYSGVGLFTIAVARRCRAVTAVEGAREAVTAGRDNAARAGVSNITFMCGEVSAVLPGLLRQGGWDAVLLDPPRAGLPPRAVEALARSSAARLVYVSCDPATLSRDVKGLTGPGGFRLEQVVPLDLFPQTHHVECVARLGRRDR
jgi:23S rRNA (uracil1939-C5)-methyltransferase